MKTTEAQKRATENYQKDKYRFTLWYSKSLKDLLEKKGITPREVFEAGLKHFKVPLPALLILLSCTSTESPQMKKASFNLKEACENGQWTWKPEPPPEQWEAYMVSGTARVPITLEYRDGFSLTCPSTGDFTLEVFYQ